jgi:hypothetical protein
MKAAFMACREVVEAKYQGVGKLENMLHGGRLLRMILCTPGIMAFIAEVPK